MTLKDSRWLALAAIAEMVCAIAQLFAFPPLALVWAFFSGFFTWGALEASEEGE